MAEALPGNGLPAWASHEGQVEVYCATCDSFQPLRLEEPAMASGVDGTRFLHGDVMCGTCYLVITGFRVA